jgi:flavin-dependent dehydrogenase
LATAIAARQKGFRVIVADGAAPPVDKACGEGMMPETLTCLEALGVEITADAGYGFRGICFAQNDASVSADFPQGLGVGLRRPVLHARLVARAEECGVQFLWKTPITGIDAERVHHEQGKIRARWIVGTDGQGSRVRRWSGLDPSSSSKKRQAARRHYRVKPWSSYMEIHWGRYTQAYVTPIAREEVCVVILSEKAEHTSFDHVLGEMPALKARLDGAELASRERGAITLMRSLRHVQRGNVALVGDASGGLDAITGEGLRLAFQQSFALADAMVAGDLTQYEAAHRKIVRGPMLMGELMLLLGRNPRLRARLLRALRGRPEIFALLLAAHVGKVTAAAIFSTGAQLGVRLLGA